MFRKSSRSIIATFLFSLMAISASSQLFNSIYTSYGHLNHLPHYNGGESRYGSGRYYSYIALDPEYGIAKEPTKIEFSVQDFEARDVYDIISMVEIYDTSSGKRLDVFPWTFRNTGDFVLYYTFPENGNYQIVLSVSTEKSVNNYGTYVVPNGNKKQIDPPRSILGSIKDCECERTVFNIKVNPTFGNIQNSLFAAIIILPLVVLGVILAKNLSRAKFNRKELLKYGVMLLALAGGILHLAVFPQHASLHIYYSIFLLAAAGSQIAYGVLYVSIALSDLKIGDTKTKQQAITLYKKNLAVNLFGLAGTAVLIGLYVYTIIFPPPFSPTNQPEEIEIEGVLAKSLEFLLFFGILSILKRERQQIRKTLIQLSK